VIDTHAHLDGCEEAAAFLVERARAAAGARTFTDDAAAVIALDVDVRLVPGERRNFKLTSAEDVAYARELTEKGLAAITAQALPR